MTYFTLLPIPGIFGEVYIKKANTVKGIEAHGIRLTDDLQNYIDNENIKFNVADYYEDSLIWLTKSIIVRDKDKMYFKLREFYVEHDKNTKIEWNYSKPVEKIKLV